jgi:hypothetical protein
VEEIYKWGASMNIPTRGASGQGEGPDIHVRGRQRSGDTTSLVSSMQSHYGRLSSLEREPASCIAVISMRAGRHKSS